MSVTRLRSRWLWIAIVGLSALGAGLVLRPGEVWAVPPAAPPPQTPAVTAPAAATPSANTPAAGTTPAASTPAAAATPGASAPAQAEASTPTAAGSAPPAGTNAAQAPTGDPNSATIIIGTTPAATATVTWGRKRLGIIKPGKPLVVVRPRDSGPLDVMVRATGFLAVQTRAHTFSDNRVMVKLTPLENISELLGYRAPVDPAVASPEQAAAWDAMAAPDANGPQVPGTFQVVPDEQPPAPLLPLAPP